MDTTPRLPDDASVPTRRRTALGAMPNDERDANEVLVDGVDDVDATMFTPTPPALPRCSRRRRRRCGATMLRWTRRRQRFHEAPLGAGAAPPTTPAPKAKRARRTRSDDERDSAPL
jgi:hypothetical protein